MEQWFFGLGAVWFGMKIFEVFWKHLENFEEWFLEEDRKRAAASRRKDWNE